MSEQLNISNQSKEVAYQTLIPQLKNLVLGESNLVANLANISSAIQMTFDHLWVGFYCVEKEQLVLGPFQGPIACTRIKKGQGVCGQAWEQKRTIIVQNVNNFPGHIACSSNSVSEIVVPIYNSINECIGVLDIDSKREAHFDETDRIYLEQVAEIIKSL